MERGILSNPQPVEFYSVGVIFVGGGDDREALAYAIRMAQHTNVRVSVIRMVEDPRKGNKRGDHNHNLQDGQMIHKYKIGCVHLKRHDYREEIVVDSVARVSVIRSLEGCFHLILVGRRHPPNTSFFLGLTTEWNDFPELGFLGDMLVSSPSNSDSSILVVQQQRLGLPNPIITTPIHNHDSFSIV